MFKFQLSLKFVERLTGGFIRIGHSKLLIIIKLLNLCIEGRLNIYNRYYFWKKCTIKLRKGKIITLYSSRTRVARQSCNQLPGTTATGGITRRICLPVQHLAEIRLGGMQTSRHLEEEIQSAARMRFTIFNNLGSVTSAG